MRRRYQILGMGIALWSAAANSSEILAQFGNSTNHPVLTYLGRYHGVGYSQGYHTCKTGNCNPVSQLYQTPSSPDLYSAVQTPPMARDPWPDFVGSIWNPLQPIDSSPAGSYSLYPSPDDGKSFGAQKSPLPPEPVRSEPTVRPAAPSSPSDNNPRLQRPKISEPLPAPKQPTPPAQSTNKWLNPSATRYHYR